MPSKIQLDENLWFLYVCLQNSDYKSIDFNGVGDVTKLKPPAARMRYTRLRRAIESGTLIGTHGTPFQGGADKIVEARRKRSKISDGVDEEDGYVVQAPTSSRLARESGSSQDVHDSNNTIAQRSDLDDMPRVKKQRRTSKTGSEAIKLEAVPDALHSGVDWTVPSNNERPSTDVHAMERPGASSTAKSKPPFSLDGIVHDASHSATTQP